MTHVRAMTFNVRQMDGEDGPQVWEHRKDVLVETIRLHRPALLGTQEIFAEQSAYILRHIPTLQCFGSGRYGDSRDKHNSIFYDREQFSLLTSGEIWISRTPEVPGSSAWDIPRPRMITWGILRDSEGSELFVMNTHFPYGRAADEARRQTARLIREKLATIPEDMPVLLTGDFNAQAGEEIYTSLTGELRDSWTTAAIRTGPEETVHGFGRFKGGRIDWILHRNMGDVRTAETITHTMNGLYPSDHYPVCAEFDYGTRGPSGTGNRGLLRVHNSQ
jgi:endonuclease/exonuclease/phosphatase family metal-dependent hydrolase